MKSRIGLWGGSCAIRLPKSAVEQLGLQEGEDVHLEVDGSTLIVRPSRPHYDLADLVDQARKLKAPPPVDLEPLGDEAL